MDYKQKNDTKKKVILIGLDGMPAEFIDRYKDKIPTIKKLLKDGFFSPALPSPTTETPTNWTTIATGTWQGTHGITGFHAHLKGMEVNKSIPTFNSSLCQAEYFWQAAERQNKKCILINYPVAFPVNFKNGVVIGGDGLSSEQWTVRWPDFISSSYNISDREDSNISIFGEIKSEIVLDMQPVERWKNVPKNFKVIREGIIKFKESEKFNWGALGIIIEEPKKERKINKFEKRYILVFRESGKTKLLISRSKDVNSSITILSKGEWSPWVEDEFFGKKCLRKYKVIDLSADGKNVTIYGTLGGCLEGWGYPKGIEKEIIDNCGPYIEAMELTPDQGLHHGWFDIDNRDTALEIFGIQAGWMEKSIEYLSKSKEWDCIFAQYHAPDGMNHTLFNGFWSDNYKVYEQTESFMLEVYKILFNMVDNIRKKCADKNTTICVVSDHGQLPIKYYINVNSIMIREGWSNFIKDSKTKLWNLDTQNSKAVISGWNSGIWINLKGREKNGIVSPGDEYKKLCNEIIIRFSKIVDPKNGKRVFDLVAHRDDLEDLGLWGERIPDIMAFTRSDYIFGPGSTENVTEKIMQLYSSNNDIVPIKKAFDAGVIRPIYSQHCNLPCAREGDFSSMRAVFFLCGMGIKKNIRGDRVNLVDVAPTIAKILDIEPPEQCEGRIIREAFE